MTGTSWTRVKLTCGGFSKLGGDVPGGLRNPRPRNADLVVGQHRRWEVAARPLAMSVRVTWGQGRSRKEGIIEKAGE